jgi:hypothetical protein
MPGFDPRSVHATFVVDKVALGQVFLRVLRFILFFIHMFVLAEGQTGEAWEPSESNALTEIGENWVEKYFHVTSAELPYDIQSYSVSH